MDKLFRWKALHLFGAGLLSLGIFSACSDELADAPKRVQAPQADPIENYIGKVNLAIEATMMPIGEDGARLQYLLGPRQLKQAVHANNGSSDANAQLRSSGGGAGGGSSEDGNPLEGNKPDADLDNTSYNALSLYWGSRENKCRRNNKL